MFWELLSAVVGFAAVIAAGAASEGYGFGGHIAGVLAGAIVGVPCWLGMRSTGIRVFNKLGINYSTRQWIARSAVDSLMLTLAATWAVVSVCSADYLANMVLIYSFAKK